MQKLVVVTGGSKGIGRAIVERFAQAGYALATCARQESDLESLKNHIDKTYNSVLHYLPADLSKRAGVEAFADFVKSLPYRLDTLVNNTGVFIPGAVLEEAEGNLEQMINTNLYSAYHLTRALAPLLITEKTGDIFNICSIASKTAYPNGGSYAISKFAMYGMSKVLREELKPKGVRVTAVLPGATWSASWAGVDLPEERLMKPEDVAEAIFTAKMLSPQSVMEELIIRPQLGDL